ncbi:hypothetical protein MWU38_03760 [Qipengyuania sp. S6317L1]|uniref:hypothetical protein n=1 Tax=Qipengyuania sp. S6317L1 TaxID=2926410 RepID=UPI001FF529D9|nr:hypothetical protein [Qipengyuania sp. S6317L1]MCK0098492.1 hypothetical protein [Qipengyuania sp. S6317L1]
MSGWVIVAIIGIVVWGIVQAAKAKAGIISDEDGNETYIGTSDGATREETEAMRAEMKQLRERLQVLERIATDNNSLDSRERARISAEIEALRDTKDTPNDSGAPLPAASKKKEQSQ